MHGARAFNFTYRYIDDVLSINNSRFAGTIRTHWHADDLLRQCPSKGNKCVIDEELQHINHLFLGVACFTFLTNNYFKSTTCFISFIFTTERVFYNSHLYSLYVGSLLQFWCSMVLGGVRWCSVVFGDVGW
jgi:hypothetical protein